MNRTSCYNSCYYNTWGKFDLFYLDHVKYNYNIWISRLHFNKHLLEVQYTYILSSFLILSVTPHSQIMYSADYHLISAYNDMLAILIFDLTHCRFVINVEFSNTTFFVVQMYSRMEYNRFTMYSNFSPWKSVNDAWLLTFSAVSGNKGNPVKQVPQLWGTFNQIKSGASRPSHHPLWASNPP